MKNKLHSGAKWVFRLRAFAGAFFLSFFLGMFSVPFILGLSNGKIFFPASLFVWLGVLTVLIAIGEIYARMAYNRWFYEFASTGLNLERGIIWKRYSNIPYGRVQNIDIHRGILARMLGFSTIDIQTAGFHAAYNRQGMPRSEGHIPAVSIKEAKKIRNFVLKKISGKHTSSQGM